MSVTYLQCVENLQRKFYEELISPSMHYQPLFTWCSRPKMVKFFKNPVSLSKNSFSASNFFMHIFNISVRYLQSAEKIQRKL